MRIIEMSKQPPWFYLIFVLVFGGCTSPVNIPTPVASNVPAISPAAPDTITLAPAASTGLTTIQSQQENLSPFSTKYAHYEPARFSDLPGWDEDKLTDAWLAFRQSCAVLHKKEAWVKPCDRSAHLKVTNSDVIHNFFEQEFKLYQIQSTNRTPAGVVTGYYEPLLTGSRKYGPPNIFPVYGSPDDMLYLNARSVPADRSREILARIEGRNVIPVLAASDNRHGLYVLEVGQALPDIRTKLIRLRVDGNRIVPYYSRSEIERSGLPRSKVILWVDNSAALYSMQIQGSGKVRLPSGEIVRLAYAEQNGHPFLPVLRAMPMQDNASGKKQIIVTRGLALLTSTENDDVANTQDQVTSDPQDETSSEPVTRSIKQPHAPEIRNNSADVERMIEQLSTPRPTSSANATPKAADAGQKKKPVNSSERPYASAIPSPAASVKTNTDPSYVFFREIPNNDGGPIGAMGVQLTPGRSIAVDPRTTPLGFPVFISTTYPGKEGTLNRLMLAQDTGGAIRGAVRADYFWGFGENAFAQASRMKENGQMWLLLPKSQQIPASSNSTLLRGAGAAKSQATECVVPDPELCVE